MSRLASIALLGLAGCSGCSAPPPSAIDAGRDSGALDAAADVSDAGTPCVSKPRPAFVPSGWREFNEYAPCSTIYVPTKVEELPEPPVWESCASDLDPPIPGCERIRPDPASKGWQADTDAAIDQGGNVLVLTSRRVPDHQTVFVADVAGKVYSAAMATDLTRYAIGAVLLQSITVPRWLFNVGNIVEKRTEGFLAGTLDHPYPTHTYREATSGRTVSVVVGAPGVLYFDGNSYLELRDFDDPNKKLYDVSTPQQNNGLPNSMAMFHGNSLFYFGNAQRRAVQRRWDVDTGPVDFIDYGDSDHGVGDLGTDGKDMVWVESHGPATKTSSWTTADYWTSPYVKNKADLKPRRLRSEIPNALAGDHIVVGCGRAALYQSLGLRLLNLKDGSSWFIANTPTTGWLTPLVVTCDYVYLRLSYDGFVTVARVPFASLGPPAPPD